MGEPFRWSWFKVLVVIQKSIVASMCFMWELDFISELGHLFSLEARLFVVLVQPITYFDSF